VSGKVDGTDRKTGCVRIRKFLSLRPLGKIEKNERMSLGKRYIGGRLQKALRDLGKPVFGETILQQRIKHHKNE